MSRTMGNPVLLPPCLTIMLRLIGHRRSQILGITPAEISIVEKPPSDAMVRLKVPGKICGSLLRLTYLDRIQLHLLRSAAEGNLRRDLIDRPDLPHQFILPINQHNLTRLYGAKLIKIKSCVKQLRGFSIARLLTTIPKMPSQFLLLKSQLTQRR